MSTVTVKRHLHYVSAALLLSTVFIFPLRSFAQFVEQTLPSCQELSDLWFFRYHDLLRVQIPRKPLDCGFASTTLRKTSLEKNVFSVDKYAQIRMALARGAYVLDQTRFIDLSELTLGAFPAIKERPPTSMLVWVSERIWGGLVIEDNAGFPTADTDNGIVHFPLALEKGDAVDILGQLIHESRHIGYPPIFHTDCDSGIGAMCDNGLTETFSAGGPHAVAALWMSWFARRSTWNKSLREKAAGVVTWVLQNRINATALEKEAWRKRYLGP